MCLRPVVCRQNDPFGCEVLQSFPCGKCLECVKDRQNSWKLRLCNEANDWSQLFFFTLTYTEDAVARNEYGRTTACRRHIQDWLKRFRTNYERRFGSLAVFKYFICAEYAPDGYYTDRHGVRRKSTCRPHYHGIIFTDIPKERLASLFKDWSKRFGFLQCKRVGATREEYSKVANYVSKYCCKGEFASRSAEIQRGEIEPAFSLMSKGIGLNYVLRFKRFHLAGKSNNFCAVSKEDLDVIISRMRISDGSFRYKMPRFYKDRIYRTIVYKPKEVWDEKNKRFTSERIDRKTGEVKQILVKRYSSQNPLQMQINKELERRYLEKSRPISEYWEPFILDGSAFGLDIFGCSPSAVLRKENNLRAKFQSFYSYNANKNANLNFFN